MKKLLYVYENEPAFCVRKQAHFTTITSSPLRHKLFQQCQTLLGRIPPQHRTQGINRHLTLAEVGAITNIPDVPLKFFYNLPRTCFLLQRAPHYFDPHFVQKMQNHIDSVAHCFLKEIFINRPN